MRVARMGSAARTLRRALHGQALSVVTVALLVGAGSAVFAIANATFVRPLPFPDDDRLAQIYLLPPDADDVSRANPLHPLALVLFQERLSLAAGVAGAWTRERAIGGESDPQSLAAAGVSAKFFGVLGVNPLLGRTFSADEERDGAAVVVLGHAVWQTRFGGDRRVTNQSLVIDGMSHQIIGVMPSGFEPPVPALLFTPLGIHRGNLSRETSTYIGSVVRMRPGVTVDQLDAEAASVGDAISLEGPPVFRRWHAHARSLREAQFGSQHTGTVLLLVAVGALALIAVANLAQLALTRALGRRLDTSLRLALGASRMNLVWDQVAGTLLVAAVGGGLGLGLSQWVLPSLVALDPSNSLPRDAAALDWRVLLATFLLAVVVTLAASLWPVLRETRRDPRSTLVDGGGRMTHGGSRTLRLVLLSAETALACLLLSASTVVFLAFDQVGRADPGFDPDRLLSAQLRPAGDRHPSVDARSLLLTNVLDALRATPGVVSAATTLNDFVPGASFVTTGAPGNPPPPDVAAQTIQFRRISDNYFETMRIPVLAGRGILSSDTRESMPVVVVSRLLADRFWPGANPIGRHMQRRTPGTPVLTVVGVVGDVSDVRLGRDLEATIYVPYRQDNNGSTPMTLVVRTAGPALDAVDPVRRAVLGVDPAQPLAGVKTLSRFLDDSLGPDRMRSTVLAAFALLGVLLSGVGIYGVTSRTVTERRREAGIRLALGGAARQVWWMMASRTLGAVGLGIAAGLALSQGASRLLSSVVPELADVSTGGALTVTIIVLCTVGGLAAILPARRATQVDLAVAMRPDSSGRLS